MLYSNKLGTVDIILSVKFVKLEKIREHRWMSWSNCKCSELKFRRNKWKSVVLEQSNDMLIYINSFTFEWWIDRKTCSLGEFENGTITNLLERQ